MLFCYRAFRNNKIISKTVEAENEKTVAFNLKRQGFFLIEIKPKENLIESNLAFFFNRVSFTDIVDLTRQLAIMLNAGLTLVDSFDILKKQVSKKGLSELVNNIEKEIKEGDSFSMVLKKYPQFFSNLYISLVKSGEASGKLSDILLKLAQNLEKQREFQGKIKGAMIYPMILILGMVGVMFVMVTFVIPKLLNLYKDFNLSLPLTTQILMAASSFSAKYWPIIIAFFIGLYILVKRFLRSNQGKLFSDSTVLKLPAISNVVKISSLVDATRTLSILIGSGVSILESLEIIIETTNNVIYQKAFRNVYKEVERGVSLGSAMLQEQIFPPILVQMVIVGEQTGKLDETLGRISHYFEMESDLAVKTMTSLIEPSILVVLGAAVGILVMSVITPIYQLTSSF